MNKYKISGLIILGLLMISIIFSIYYRQNESERIHQHMVSANNSDVCDHENNDFCTHLPIVTIDIGSQEFPNEIDEIKQEELINGIISIVDNDDKNNHIYDTANVSSPMKIRIRGNSSIYYDKKQYLIKLIDENGNDNKISLLGMSADEEWVLNGSYIDKSLIRNYMALNIAGEIMDYSPRVRFCEVFIREGSDQHYIGVYLLIESVKRGEERIDIGKYNPNEDYTSYILRRDRFSENEEIIENYGTVFGYTDEYLGIKYPSKNNIDHKAIAYIENNINMFEEKLYSDEKKQVYWYDQYINVDSFVDYFIINEFFGNYDAGLHSTYVYRDVGGKLTMGPVWDFDQAIDNYSKEILNTEMIALKDYAWFDGLVKDPIFTERIIERYKQLRKGVLSESYINQYIDETVAYLGEAIDRDINIWGQFYNENYLDIIKLSNGQIIDRNTKSYEEEIIRIKEVLHAKGTWMDANIDRLCYCNDDNIKPTEPADYGALLFIGFFLLVIILVRRS